MVNVIVMPAVVVPRLLAHLVSALPFCNPPPRFFSGSVVNIVVRSSALEVLIFQTSISSLNVTYDKVASNFPVLAHSLTPATSSLRRHPAV